MQSNDKRISAAELRVMGKSHLKLYVIGNLRARKTYATNRLRRSIMYKGVKI